MVSNWCLCGEVVLRLMWPRYPRSVWPVASIFCPKLNSSLLEICDGSHLLSVTNSFGLRSLWRITPTFGRKNVWLGNLWRITSTFRPKWFWRPPLRPEICDGLHLFSSQNYDPKYLRPIPSFSVTNIFLGTGVQIQEGVVWRKCASNQSNCQFSWRVFLPQSSSFRQVFIEIAKSLSAMAGKRKSKGGADGGSSKKSAKPTPDPPVDCESLPSYVKRITDLPPGCILVLALVSWL